MTTTAYSAVRLRREQRHMRLLQLGYKGYPEYLRSPHWQGVKARYRASDLPQDCICGVEQVQLHHLTYERVGNEPLGDLTPLCGRCHAMIHELERRGEMGLDFAGLVNAERAKRYHANRPVKLVEWPPEVERLLQSIADVRESAEQLPDDLGKLLSRELWLARAKLDRLETKLRTRMSKSYGSSE